MEYCDRSRRYGNGQTMQIGSYYGAPGPYSIRTYSASYAQTQMGPIPKDLKWKKGKSISGSSWSFNDPELQRKKRVASYKMYSVEGKVKGSLRKSFRWFKDKCSQINFSQCEDMKCFTSSPAMILLQTVHLFCMTISHLSFAFFGPSPVTERAPCGECYT